MPKLPCKAIVFVYLALLGAAIYGIGAWGAALKRHAAQRWLQKASEETQRITDASMYRLSLCQSQLRGLAALFHGSEDVTESEFLNALELIEGFEVETVIPLTAIAYLGEESPERAAAGRTAGGRHSVLLSSDSRGLFAVGSDAANRPEIRAAILAAAARPEQVTTGPVFNDENGRTLAAFAITAPNGGKPGILLSVIDLGAFMADLDALLIPRGISLRIAERPAEGRSGGGRTIVERKIASAQAVGTFYVPSQIGYTQWDYYWDVLPSYLGGPDTALGTAVQWGGGTLVLAVFAIMGFLARQNMQVNRLVVGRTAELSEATRKAETANQAKSVFLANMSHELRTPMNAILGYAQLMQREASLKSEQREYLNTINRSGEHLLALINDVLDISKIEARQIALEPVDFLLQAMFLDLEAMFRIRTDAKGLRLDLIGTRALPLRAVADENKLRQVLINLLDNAVKFTDEGGVAVRLAVANRSADQMRLVVEVEDSGEGIACEELEKVFEAFGQTASGRRTGSGTGLGMAISRDYARMMGGDLTVVSKVGEGSVFRLEIGVGEAREAGFREKARPRRVVGLAAGQAVRRILIADDKEENRDLLARLLEPAGFAVRTAANGREAMDRTSSRRGGRISSGWTFACREPTALRRPGASRPWKGALQR